MLQHLRCIKLKAWLTIYIHWLGDSLDWFGLIGCT